MMQTNEMLLLKLGEVVLKGLNRRSFEDKLVSNVRRRLRAAAASRSMSGKAPFMSSPRAMRATWRPHTPPPAVFAWPAVARPSPQAKP